MLLTRFGFVSIFLKKVQNGTEAEFKFLGAATFVSIIVALYKIFLIFLACPALEKYDIRGNIIKRSKTSGSVRYNCLMLCHNNPQCNAWTLNSVTNECYQHSKAEEAMENNDAVIGIACRGS